MASFKDFELSNSNNIINKEGIFFTGNCLIKISNNEYIKVEDLSNGIKILSGNGYQYLKHVVKVFYKGTIFKHRNLGFTKNCICIINKLSNIASESFYESEEYEGVLFNFIFNKPSLVCLYDESFKMIEIPSLGSYNHDYNSYFLSSEFIEWINDNFSSFEITLDLSDIIYDEEKCKIIGPTSKQSGIMILTKLKDCGASLFNRFKEKIGLLSTIKEENETECKNGFDFLCLLEEGKYTDLSKTQVTKTSSKIKIAKITVIYEDV